MLQFSSARSRAMAGQAAWHRRGRRSVQRWSLPVRRSKRVQMNVDDWLPLNWGLRRDGTRTHRSDDYQRSHHVMLLVLENVAMPDILVTASAWTGWHGERCRSEIEFHDDRCALAGVHPDGFFPATLVRIGRPRWAKKVQMTDIERLS